MEVKVYISGKISGEDPILCKNKFLTVEKKLKKLGVNTVINPTNMGIPQTWSWEEQIAMCMKVLTEKANTIVMLNDWVKSKGAMIEYYHARNHGYRIFFEDDTEEIVELVTNNGKWIDTSQNEFP